MSGFEAVGIILGAWPLVVNAMTVYKLTKSGTGLSLMLHELKTEEMIYTQFVHNLLVSDVTEAELMKLSNRENPDSGLWKNELLHNNLKQRLGLMKSELVFEKLEEIGKILASLNQKLGGKDAVTVRTL